MNTAAATAADTASDTATDQPAPAEIPIVDYLVLGKQPHLVANQCTKCPARFFNRRNACASCGEMSFEKAKVSNTGVLAAFTIVHRAAPTIEVPYVSAIIKTDDGTSVRANVVNVEADPEHVKLGMKLALTTYEVSQDDRGTKCIAFGYEPA